MSEARRLCDHPLYLPNFSEFLNQPPDPHPSPELEGMLRDLNAFFKDCLPAIARAVDADPALSLREAKDVIMNDSSGESPPRSFLHSHAGDYVIFWFFDDKSSSEKPRAELACMKRLLRVATAVWGCALAGGTAVSLVQLPDHTRLVEEGVPLIRERMLRFIIRDMSQLGCVSALEDVDTIVVNLAPLTGYVTAGRLECIVHSLVHQVGHVLGLSHRFYGDDMPNVFTFRPAEVFVDNAANPNFSGPTLPAPEAWEVGKSFDFGSVSLFQPQYLGLALSDMATTRAASREALKECMGVLMFPTSLDVACVLDALGVPLTNKRYTGPLPALCVKYTDPDIKIKTDDKWCNEFAETVRTAIKLQRDAQRTIARLPQDARLSPVGSEDHRPLTRCIDANEGPVRFYARVLGDPTEQRFLAPREEIKDVLRNWFNFPHSVVVEEGDGQMTVVAPYLMEGGRHYTVVPARTLEDCVGKCVQATERTHASQPMEMDTSPQASSQPSRLKTQAGQGLHVKRHGTSKVEITARPSAAMRTITALSEQHIQMAKQILGVDSMKEALEKYKNGEYDSAPLALRNFLRDCASNIYQV